LRNIKIDDGRQFLEWSIDCKSAGNEPSQKQAKKKPTSD
jgi:hypothetical protein